MYSFKRDHWNVFRFHECHWICKTWFCRTIVGWKHSHYIQCFKHLACPPSIKGKKSSIMWIMQSSLAIVLIQLALLLILLCIWLSKGFYFFPWSVIKEGIWWGQVLYVFLCSLSFSFISILDRLVFSILCHHQFF